MFENWLYNISDIGFNRLGIGKTEGILIDATLIQ